jgi:hypothetical protein
VRSPYERRLEREALVAVMLLAIAAAYRGLHWLGADVTCLGSHSPRENRKWHAGQSIVRTHPRSNDATTTPWWGKILSRYPSCLTQAFTAYAHCSPADSSPPVGPV